MGRGAPIRWEHRTATLDDGRTIEWTWQPAGRYPQIVTAHVDDVLVLTASSRTARSRVTRMWPRNRCARSATLTAWRITRTFDC
jgi:hypothetical protein